MGVTVKMGAPFHEILDAFEEKGPIRLQWWIVKDSREYLRG